MNINCLADKCLQKDTVDIIGVASVNRKRDQITSQNDQKYISGFSIHSKIFLGTYHIASTMKISIESGFDSCKSYTLAEIKDGIVCTYMNPQK